MSDGSVAEVWRYHKFGMLVTGKGEQDFLPELLKPLTIDGNCTFTVIRRIGQRSPVTSEKRKLRMVGSGKTIPNLDMTDIGLPARNFLRSDSDSFVIIVDDLEHDRLDIHKEVFNRYRACLDSALPTDQKGRASVHFLVNMLEAYYFADADAVNQVLGTQLENHLGDVEEIRHPKSELRSLAGTFDEVNHGRQIVARLNLELILGNPETCASLRTLFKWCTIAIRGPIADRFRLATGRCSPVTAAQLSFTTSASAD